MHPRNIARIAGVDINTVKVKRKRHNWTSRAIEQAYNEVKGFDAHTYISKLKEGRTFGELALMLDFQIKTAFKAVKTKKITPYQEWKLFQHWKENK